MKLRTSFLIATLPIGVSAQVSERTLKVDLAKSVVAKYQDLAQERNGQAIVLKFSPSASLQLLGGHTRSGESTLEVFEGALSTLDRHELAAALCHEIGHIVAEVKIRMTNAQSSYHPNDAVEGEADYFGGSCTVGLLTDGILESRDLKDPNCKSEDTLCATAIRSARSLYKKIYRAEVDESAALSAIYRQHAGINPSYPDPSCRLLSFVNGVKQVPRPLCWFNP